MEFYIKDGALIKKQDWEDTIDALRTKTVPADKKHLESAMIESIIKRIPKSRCGLLLSGGVDSSLIALLLKKQGADFICYTVGREDSEDLKQSILLAKSLGLTHKTRILNLEDINECLKKAKKIFKDNLFPNNPNPAVLLGVAAVEIAALELAKQDNLDLFFTGLGAEEIFAGYNRHGKTKDINDECWAGLRDIVWSRDLSRDALIADHFNISFATPFLDKDLIKVAMGIEGKDKITTQKKAVLREIAQTLGLEEEFAWRKKKAAQYGSSFNKAIERLSKDHGFRYTRDYFDSI